jgi:hypothetical protein
MTNHLTITNLYREQQILALDERNLKNPGQMTSIIRNKEILNKFLFGALRFAERKLL